MFLQEVAEITSRLSFRGTMPRFDDPDERSRSAATSIGSHRVSRASFAAGAMSKTRTRENRRTYADKA
jgi:hypothetical protein